MKNSTSKSSVASLTAVDIGGCIQKFRDWPPGTRTTNGTALCSAVVSLFCETV